MGLRMAGGAADVGQDDRLSCGSEGRARRVPDEAASRGAWRAVTDSQRGYLAAIGLMRLATEKS